MTSKTIEILEKMNAWRRHTNDGLTERPVMPCPREFGLAVDAAVGMLQANQAAKAYLSDRCDCSHEHCSTCSISKEAIAILSGN